MRVLVDGRGLSHHPRMRGAALGLARRGHEVWWHPARGDSEPALADAGVRLAPAGMALGRLRVQVVLGAGRPAAVTRLGWLAGAHGLVVSALTDEPRSWGLLDRWAFASLTTFTLVEEGAGASIQAAPGPLVLGQVGLWSDETPDAHGRAEHLDTEILERAGERVIAHHRGAAPRPAVFLDRDGTLVAEVGYLDDPERLELIPGVPEALRRLQASGFALVVISNQAGVGRGLYPLARAHATMARLRILLRREGVELDGIYFCPHAPDQGCACRKPGIELLERAADDLVLDPGRSAMIGDKLIDVETGHRFGALGILVRTGYGEEESRRSEQQFAGRPPDRVCANLAEAIAWLTRGSAEI